MTIVGPAEDSALPQALRELKTTIFRQHYIPVALLALHEQAFLVDRTTASIVSEPTLKDQSASIRQLEDIRDATLLFRLCFHFSELSYISMHNALHRAFREVYGTERMLGDLGSTVAEVTAHLVALKGTEDRRREDEKHKRYYWTSITGAAALAGLTTFTIVKELGKVLMLGEERGSWVR